MKASSLVKTNKQTQRLLWSITVKGGSFLFILKLSFVWQLPKFEFIHNLKTRLKLFKPKKLFAACLPHALRLASLLLLFSLLVIPLSQAFLQDQEVSRDNYFQAGSIDIVLRSGQSNFVSDPLDLQPGDLVTRDIYVQKLGLLDGKYRSEFEFVGGDQELCEALELRVYYNWYDALPPAPGNQSTRHMDLKYQGILSNFVDFTTNTSTHDPDMIILNSKQYFDNIFYANNEHWFYYSLKLPQNAVDSLVNKTCNFNLRTTAWQTDYDDVGGFWDTEIIESTVATGDWTSSEVTVCKYDDQQQPVADWPIFLQGQHQETVTVSSNGSVVTSSNLLETDYLLKANGTYTYWSSQLPIAGIADAAYSLRPEGNNNPGPGPQWISGDSLDVPWQGYLEIQVNSTNVDWGQFNPNHQYVYGLTNWSGPISFNIVDSNYGDNSDELEVKIYQGYAGTTGENGCVTFNEVEFGQYQLDELLPVGWQYLEGDRGLVEIDQSNEQFSLINRWSGIVLNEILYNPVGDDSGLMPAGEMVELYNNGDQDEDVVDWYLRDDAGAPIYIAASNSDNNLNPYDGGETVVPAHGSLVVYLESNDYLDNNGDSVSLYNSNDHLIDRHSYGGGKSEGYSETRITDGVGAWIDPIATLGWANATIDNQLEPFIKLWQQGAHETVLGLFAIWDYEAADYTINYQRQQEELMVEEQLQGSLEIDRNSIYLPHIFMGTVSSDYQYPHFGIQDAKLKVILRGAGLPDRTLETDMTGGWVEQND